MLRPVLCENDVLQSSSRFLLIVEDTHTSGMTLRDPCFSSSYFIQIFLITFRNFGFLALTDLKTR
jgi:hypothetical protein